MRTKVVILIIVLVVLLILLGVAAYVFFPILMSGRGDTLNADVPEVNITYENFEEQLMRQSLVQDIPEEGAMILHFYNYNSGKQAWENSYILRRGNVQKGMLDNADIVISMHSKYLATLTNKNLCATINAAQDKGDVSFETGLSKTALAWKYRSMLEYKECLGFD